MTHPDPSPTPEDTDDVRERILAAASKEFAAHGLKGCTVRTIAARAEVTAAMINYYFGGKLALYEVIVERGLKRQLEQFSRAIAGTEPTDLPVTLAGVYFDFLCAEHDFQRLLAREVLDRGSEGLDLARKHLGPFRSALENVFGGDDAVFQAAVSIFGAVAGYFLYEPILAELLGEDPLSPENLARRRQHVLELAARVSEMESDR